MNAMSEVLLVSLVDGINQEARSLASKAKLMDVTLLWRGSGPHVSRKPIEIQSRVCLGHEMACSEIGALPDEQQSFTCITSSLVVNIGCLSAYR